MLKVAGSLDLIQGPVLVVFRCSIGPVLTSWLSNVWCDLSMIAKVNLLYISIYGLAIQKKQMKSPASTTPDCLKLFCAVSLGLVYASVLNLFGFWW